jgi:hypothetical protein
MTFIQFLDKHFTELMQAGGVVLGATVTVFVLYGIYKLVKEI